MAAAIALAALLAYANALRAPFVLDDAQSVTQNPSIRDLGRLRAVLTPDSGTTAGRPLVNLSFAVNRAWSGEGVGSYHLFNLGVHVAAGLVLFGLVRRTLLRPAVNDSFRGRALSLAAMVAMLWTVHPLQTEVVTYVSERSEALMGLCYLFVLYALVRAVESRRPKLWLAASVAAGASGMACKEVMVTVPVVVLLFDRTFFGASFADVLGRRRSYYGALALTWPLLAWLMIAFPIAGRGVGFGFGVGPLRYLATEANAIVTYIARAFWPHPLVFDYGPNCFAQSVASAAPSILLVLGALGATIVAWCRTKPLGFLLAAFFILLSPTSSVVPIALQPMAESRMYLPLAPLLTFGVLAAYAAAARFERIRAAWTFGAVSALALVAATVARNRDYASAVALWTDTVAKVPDNPRAHNSLGSALAAEGQTARAVAEFNAALRADPEYAPAHFNLGVTLLDANRPGEALPHLQKARAVPNEQARLQLYLGQAYAQLGRYAQAVPPLREAVRLAPGEVEPAFALGNALAAGEHYGEAADAFRLAAKAAPNQSRVINNLANALAYAGRLDEAIVEYRRALTLSPGDESIRDNLAQAERLRDARRGQ